MNLQSPISSLQSPVAPSRIHILGIAVDDVLPDEAMERLAGWLAQGGPHHVVTVNPEFVMEARRNPAFRQVLHAADMALPDGVGLLYAARFLGMPLRGRVTGVELTHRLAALAAERGVRLFLLGAAPGVAEEAAAALVSRYPGLTIAGCYAGTPQPRHEPFLRQLIAAARPDVLLVAYGHPRQDMWIARNQPFVQVPIAVGVGGVFDYLAGHVPLAPAWLRRLGLEWLYRLLKQPHRWRRIFTAVVAFTWAVVTKGKAEG
ncbi:MAG: WecB/TagA/CpsF family glycosyltransferase [Chloroflexaceae bacterium]|jgi:N-acetylglucosaminyldiphosphoundecaprenol N-acetyl-beta-D-mannosaminyltransferase|nr:WecB/TagA/CpsF family glycosyltransferase [Chloroflexaceae bacterium]